MVKVLCLLGLLALVGNGECFLRLFFPFTPTAGVAPAPAPAPAPVPTNIVATTDPRNSNEFDPNEPRRVPLMTPMPGCGLAVPVCPNPASIYRTMDGSCNNPSQPFWGVPNNIYTRLRGARYADGVRSPRIGSTRARLPAARVVRTSLFPAGTRINAGLTLNAMQFGQFLAHDLSMLRDPDTPINRCCTADRRFQKPYSPLCFPIKVPPTDPTMGPASVTCLNFTRTLTDWDFGCVSLTTPARQINSVTSWIDLSNVYGINNERARGLRSFQGGRLIIETRNTRTYPPTETDRAANCPCNTNTETTCYRTGDPRTNQNPQLAITQITYHREHNRIAAALASLNPTWNDERLYQEARRINIACFQYVSYYEWLPNFMGRTNLANQGIIYSTPSFVNDYNPQADPGISNEFAHAAFRKLHTNIVGIFNLLSSTRATSSTQSLSNWFFRPNILEQGSNWEQITLGMLTQNMEETDQIFVEQITDRMAGCRGGFGTDLRAADIQRDRDHALGYYNDYRAFCGLRVATSFDDYADLIPFQYIATLKSLYANYQDVDLSVGGALETLVAGTHFGPTFLCIMNDQFRRTRKADKFWFENSGSGFTAAQLAEIRKASVSRLFCDNHAGVTNIQPYSFNTISGTNPVVPCSNLPFVNLAMWRA